MRKSPARDRRGHARTTKVVSATSRMSSSIAPAVAPLASSSKSAAKKYTVSEIQAEETPMPDDKKKDLPGSLIDLHWINKDFGLKMSKSTAKRRMNPKKIVIKKGLETEIDNPHPMPHWREFGSRRYWDKDEWLNWFYASSKPKPKSP